jgi:hypothetical protein
MTQKSLDVSVPETRAILRAFPNQRIPKMLLCVLPSLLEHDQNHKTSIQFTGYSKSRIPDESSFLFVFFLKLLLKIS